ncbi:MAG: hypothetical protein K2X99_05510 [Gemmatimonadaceae bacterium]|nr:hypothetical protein [Gemmatimonadaceae bacterium]
MHTTRIFRAALLAVALSAPRLAHAQLFKVIAHPETKVEEASAADLSKIFLKQKTAFADGTPAVPVDQAKVSTVRGMFTRSVLGKSVSDVEGYWQQQIFSGKDQPPAQKPKDDDVIEFVKTTPGAIGYVGGGAATAGVKVIKVK